MQTENTYSPEGKTCQDEYISYECVKNFLTEGSYLEEYHMEGNAISTGVDQSSKVIPSFEYDFFDNVA